MVDNGLVTEAGGDAAAGYEKRETLELVELMNEADSTVPAAVGAVAADIAAVVDTVAAFSVVTHFDGFQRGVIDARDLLFFLSVIGFALFATGVVIRSHRSG